MDQKAVTYLLDENYYVLVDKLAIEIEIKINMALEDIVNHFINYLECNQIEKLKTPSEYGLELLYIGVLYVSYSKKVDSTYLKQLENLFDQLFVTKEFDEITSRLRLWLTCWRLDEGINQDFQKVLALTDTFLRQCDKMLNQYTLQVPEFIQKARQTYRDREDLLFVTRSINEYYINMVGAQILNRVYQDEFKQVDKVYVFVPGCMAIQLDKCKASAGKMGYICAKCTSSCPINLTLQIGERYNADTVIVYHSSELYHTKVSSTNIKYGVVGIACVLNLISGGLKARELGYVPQCILLNYCGCKQHWNSEGLVTDINRNRLEQLLIG